MELSGPVKVLLIMNNYFHDVATAVLLSSAVVLWVLGTRARREGPEALGWFAGAFPVLSRFALGAIVWIVIGGIPRTIFFTQLEWDPAMQGGLVPALIVKHVLFVVAITAGGTMWWRLRSMLREASGLKAPLG